MTLATEPLNVAWGSVFDSFKNDSKAQNSVAIPAQSYTTRQLRQFSFSLPLQNNLAPSQAYINFDFESDKWMLLNGNTYANHPQNFELNLYTAYGTNNLTIHVDITNRNTTTVTLNSFVIIASLYSFITSAV